MMVLAILYTEHLFCAVFDWPLLHAITCDITTLTLQSKPEARAPSKASGVAAPATSTAAVTAPSAAAAAAVSEKSLLSTHPKETPAQVRAVGAAAAENTKPATAALPSSALALASAAPAPATQMKGGEPAAATTALTETAATTSAFEALEAAVLARIGTL